MNEREGCALLKRCFERAGFAIAEHVRFDVGDAAIFLDGWDPARRVGYEYVTAEAGDRNELTPAVLAALEAGIAAGELHLLVVDEEDVPGPEVLERAADAFLAELRRRGRS